MFFDRLIAVLNSSTINYTHNTNNEMTSAGAVSYSYDQNGNTIQETNGVLITKYIYNSSNRLERVELPDGRIAEYKYDPFGRRISKTINNSASADGLTTYYLYADEGLIGEYDSSGNNIKSYGWTPDSIWGTNPVFMQESGNYYFYHNDHLGTPQKMTDINGNVVWSATYTAFGEATVDAGSTITNNLRFAGQYFDEETGKHYNWNRYYDPKTGRYTQVDPIGFEGGINIYGYVQNMPILYLDPYALASVCNIPSIGPYSTLPTSIKKCASTSLIDCIIKAESGGNPKAVSKKGAKGLMQTMPIAIKELKQHKLYDPKMTDKEVGTKYMDLLLSYCDSVTYALAAYNAGPTTTNKAGGVPNIGETKDYINKIDKCLKEKGLKTGVADSLATVKCECE